MRKILKWLMADEPGSPIAGVDDPEFQAPAEEAALAGLSIEDAEDPDGVKIVPKQEAFDKLLKEEMTGEFTAPAAKEEEFEEIHEADLLSKAELKHENVDDLITDYKGKVALIDQLTQLMGDQGYQVFDNVLQDMVDSMEQQAASKLPGFLGGAQTPEIQPTEVVAPRGSDTPAASPAEIPMQFTNALLAKYPQLKWTPDFVKEMSQALYEHNPRVDIPKADDFVSRTDMQEWATLNKNLFRDQMVNEHMIERLQSGDKLPASYRQRLTAEMAKNPAALEQAWRGYATRGRYNGVMGDYSRTLRADEDPDTGLTGAEATAAVKEQANLNIEKKGMRGGDAPKTGGKRKAVTVIELESTIESLARKVI